MSDLGLSTIAQLLFPNTASLNFARTVAELEAVLSRPQSCQVRIAWDCDDFVCFDIPGTRIQLAWSEVDRRGYTACLTISVGPVERASPRFHEDMCSRLVERIRTRFDPVAVMWCQAEGDVGADVIDDLLDALPHLGTILPAVETLLDGLSQQEARLSARTTVKDLPKRSLPGPVAANDQPDLPRPQDAQLQRVREALYPHERHGRGYSTQMRLAVHCLNATLILVWGPLGAAVMAYSLVKGEDMRLSARIMAVTGTFLAFASTPFGMTVAAMAKSIV